MNNSVELKAISRTSNGGYPYIASITTVDADSLCKFVEKEKFSELCRIGCKNYKAKWACPPFSPDYNNIYTRYKYITILLLSMDTSHFYHIKNSYLKIKAANVMIKSRVDRLLRTCDGRFISTGSCRLCKPCKLKINERCAHPDKMAYSFEALGIDVTAMSKELFQYDMLWYKKGFLPNYTGVAAGLLTNSKVDEQELLSRLAAFN